LDYPRATPVSYSLQETFPNNYKKSREAIPHNIIFQAHLDPAVNIAMVIGDRMSIKNLPVYIFAQLFGTFLHL